MRYLITTNIQPPALTKWFEFMYTLFEIEKTETKETCRTCEHRERWQCGGRVIQYCGVRKSNRTENGLLKITVTTPACPNYKKQPT